MTSRYPTIAAITATLILAGCARDMPTGPETLRLALVAGAEHGGRPFATAMTQEVFTTPTVYFGDPDGSGTALITINLGKGELCWDITVEDIAPLPASAAHIHRAAAGAQGPISVGITAPNASGESVGCRTGVDRGLLNDILTSPESFYVNVHTTQFPTGAVRGQLGG